MFLEIVNIPKDVEVMKIRIAMDFPRNVLSEKIRIIRIRIPKIVVDSLL